MYKFVELDSLGENLHWSDSSVPILDYFVCETGVLNLSEKQDCSWCSQGVKFAFKWSVCLQNKLFFPKSHPVRKIPTYPSQHSFVRRCSPPSGFATIRLLLVEATWKSLPHHQQMDLPSRALIPLATVQRGCERLWRRWLKVSQLSRFRRKGQWKQMYIWTLMWHWLLGRFC